MKKKWAHSKPSKQKPVKKSRPRPTRKKAILLKKSKSRVSPWRRRLAAAALIGAVTFGSFGCSYVESKAKSEFTYSKFRDEAEKSAGRALAGVTGVVPGGSSIGKDIGSKAVELVLGPNPEKVIRGMKGKVRFDYSKEGLPVKKNFWFKAIGLNPKNKLDQNVIDYVERVERNTSLFPEEIMLIVGVNAHLSPYNLRKKVQVLKGFLRNHSATISALGKDAKRFKPKLNRKREIILEQLSETFSSRDQIACEFLGLDGILRLMFSYPEEFNHLMAIGRANFNPATCKRDLNNYYLELAKKRN